MAITEWILLFGMIVTFAYGIYVSWKFNVAMRFIVNLLGNPELYIKHYNRYQKKHGVDSELELVNRAQ